jgi:site-specific recombinase XerD
VKISDCLLVGISAIIKQIANDAGLKGEHIHAHSLRHSFAHILETGNKQELVSKMLGHTSTLTTEILLS